MELLIPIVLFVVIGYVIKTISENNLKKDLIDKGLVNENLKYLFSEKKDNCRGPRYSPVQVHDNSPPVQLFSDMIQKLSY